MKVFDLKKGFTLVEIMVVISIISFLASIVSVGLIAGKMRAKDAARVATVNSLRTAVTLYKADHGGSAPNISGGMTVPLKNGTTEFRNILAGLVSGGYISSLPEDLDIFYFNVGKGTGSEDAVVIGTTLTTVPPTVTGQGGTCRPFNQGGNNIASNCTVTNGYISCPPPPPTTEPCVEEPPQEGYAQTLCADELRLQIFDSDNPTQCNDSTDNDGDGLIDMADPGCTSINDTNETNQTAAYCSNVVSNSDYCLCS